MGTFDGRIKELENVLIDDFQLYKSHTCFFLSHCHSDHMTGLDELFSNINADSDFHVYCSSISRLILLNKYKLGCENIVKELTSATVMTVPGNDVAPCYQITVTPIPAGHCPGSIMFLFETTKKAILYTGDFRILKNDIPKFEPFKIQRKLDKLYLDSTFLNEIYWHFPLRSEAVAELLTLIRNWINKSPSHNVMLQTSAVYGYEYVFVELARKLKCKIHVKDALYNLFWNVPEVGIFLTKHCSSTQVHAFRVFDTKCNPCRKGELLKIKLSAQWYKSGRGDSKPLIWKQLSSHRICLCYSTHCSCSELVDFLNYLKPKSVQPCTTAVGSTKEEMKVYINQLISSWNIEERNRSRETTKIDFQLERNYKFKLKIPVCENTDFEESVELNLIRQKT